MNKAVYFSDYVSFKIEFAEHKKNKDEMWKQLELMYAACQVGNYKAFRKHLVYCIQVFDVNRPIHLICSPQSYYSRKTLSSHRCLSTVLYNACYIGNFEIVEYLCTNFKNIIDINKKDENRFVNVIDTPILIAAERMNFKIVRYLWKHFRPSININQQESMHDRTVHHFACLHEDWKTIKFLGGSAFDVNIQDGNGDTVLHLLCRVASLNVIRSFCRRNKFLIRMDIRGLYKRTVLEELFHAKKEHILKYLLKKRF